MSNPDPRFPRPPEVRLVRGWLARSTLTATAAQGARGRQPAPPFGLSTWSDSANAAVVVVLDLPTDWAQATLDDVQRIAVQIPPAGTLVVGTMVFVLGTGNREGGVVSRLLRPRATVTRAVRGSALLTRGYVQIRGGVDPASREDLVWGSAPAQ